MKRFTGPEGTEYVTFRCPGCLNTHVLPITGSKAWGFNGNLESPTLTPSILCRYYAFDPETEQCSALESVCHSFVKDGQIQFLDDCSHTLKGKTVEIPSEKEG